MFPRRIAGLLVLTPFSLLACCSAEAKKSISPSGANPSSPAAASSMLRTPPSKRDSSQSVARDNAPFVPDTSGDTRGAQQSMPAPALAGAADLDPHNDGRTISVERHFGRPSGEPRGPEGLFLRTLARGAYDDGIFSCVITEFFDSLHRNHIHVDLARYRVDGTR